MSSFFYVFLVCIIILIVLICITTAYGLSKKERKNNFDDFLDENGNHRYYERSIIRKHKYIKENPDVDPQEIRSFKRLLKKPDNNHK